MKLFVRSLLFNIAFFGWTSCVAILVLPSLMMTRTVLLRAVKVWVRGVLLLQRLAGQRVQLRGQDKIPPWPVLVASKHQSAWDTLIFNIALDDPCFVLKKELYRIPIFGWELRHASMIAIDRRGGASALKGMLRDAKQAISSGRSILIFPEGTRTQPGTCVPYQPGITALYQALGLSVLPVALNSGKCWPRRGFLRYPGTIVVEFQSLIPPGLGRSEFEESLRNAIENSTVSLC